MFNPEAGGSNPTLISEMKNMIDGLDVIVTSADSRYPCTKDVCLQNVQLGMIFWEKYVIL